MRTPEDNCLLCEKNKALKTNSHIVPSFMTKSLLESGGVRRSYRFSTDNMHLETPFSQDTDKENYILCPECEKYFSVLETYWSTHLHNRLWHIDHQNKFMLEQNQNGVSWKICIEINQILFRLFIYSLVWRCSISNSHTFHRFSIAKSEEEALRDGLLVYRTTTQSDLLKKLNQKSERIPIFPFEILTSERFDSTNHLVFCDPNKRNPYQLMLNEYIIRISFVLDTNQGFIQEFVNNSNGVPIKIGWLPLSFWIERIKSLTLVFTKKTIENLEKSNDIEAFVQKMLKQKRPAR